MTVIQEGRWRLLPNQVSGLRGAVHDAEQAGRMGFRRGVVGGSVILGMALRGVWAQFGPRFLDGGWLAFTFVSPVYDDEEVREVAEEAPDETIDLRVETRDGRVCAAGHAGMGTELPWDPAKDGSHGADEAFPHAGLGHRFPDLGFTPDQATQKAILEAARDAAPWFRGWEWGPAVVNPALMMGVALDLPRDLRLGEGVNRSGLNAGLDLVWERPMPLDGSYIMSGHLADKGIAGRTWFRTVEFQVHDPQGDRYCLGRQKVKFLIEN